MIDDFRGPYRWLSNYHESPVLGYGSNEAFYQAHKTLDPVIRTEFKALSPNESKKAGKKIELRPDWEVIKDKVMFVGLKAKFCDVRLWVKLEETGTEFLKEGNYWHDNYWGDCHCGNLDEQHPECLLPGKNMLGHQLMIIRAPDILEL